MLEKPLWKLEAERIGESLPEYWTLAEIAQELGLGDASYLSRLAREGKIPAYKVGPIRLVKNEQVQMVMDKIRKK